MEMDTRELSLTDLEDELVRVKQAQKITEDFLNSINSLTPEKLAKLQELRADLEILKNLNKKIAKEKFMINLTERETNLGKAIAHMKKSKEKTYNPKSVVF